jgi:hypothetical protein
MIYCHKEQRFQAHTQKKLASEKIGIIYSNWCHFRVSSTFALYEKDPGFTPRPDDHLS